MDTRDNSVISFNERVLRWLKTYREEVLRIPEEGVFRYRGQDLRKPHILPIAQADLNLFEPYRQRFCSPRYSGVKRHRYFHHLNSSQALCLNLFLPLVEEGRLELFLGFLGIPSDGLAAAEFEKLSSLERVKWPTNFDFYARCLAGEVFVEVKYTENGFGSAKNDREHCGKFRQTYARLINSAFLTPECLKEDVFLRNYQILRNLIHIQPKSNVVLLFPSANRMVAEEAEHARRVFLTDAGRERLKIARLEKLIEFLEESLAGTPLAAYYREFRRKYLFGMQADRQGPASEKGF